ncbi:MAG: tetratricopeptide repeat protein, partial [Planctomycetota bacterium]
MRAVKPLATLLLAALAAGAAGQDEAAQSSILERVPDSLPRSDDGRWATFFEDVAPEKIAQRVGEESMGELARGEALYEQNDFPGALRVLYPLLEAQPDMPPALLILGTSYFRLRRYGDTITCLERFVDVAPSEVWRTQALGHSYYSLGRYEDAQAHYGQVLAVLPDSPEATRGLALSHMRLGDYPRALELLERVVELDSENWEAHAWRAQILFEEGDLEAALEAAETARLLVPHEPRPWFLLKKIFWELGRDDDADAAERRWRELDALTQELRSAKGRLLFNPKSFGLARQVAELTARVGDVVGTRKALDQVVRNTPEEVRRVDVYVYALDLLWDLNDREGCERAAQALQIACSEEPAAWRRLERYYGETGRRREQIEAGERWRR